MICPFCLHKKSEVYNSRSKQNGVVWRRRRCLACERTFTTEEAFDPSTAWKVKHKDRITPYSRAKLALSLLRACDHRPNKDDVAWFLYKTVEQKLLPIVAAQHQTLEVAQIIEEAGRVLKRFDATAYVKYLSYHQPVTDVRTLRKQLRRS